MPSRSISPPIAEETAVPSTSRLLLINPNTDRRVTAAMTAIARETLPIGFEVEGATVLHDPLLITDSPALEAAAAAVIDLIDQTDLGHCAGLIIAAFGDPGLDAARVRWTLPITGIAEAGMAEAAAGGRSFSVITTTPCLVDPIAARARAYGHGERFLGVRLTPGDPAPLMADPDRLVAALEDACRAAIEIDGAEAIVIGGGPLAIAARALQGRFRLHGHATAVPIIEPISRIPTPRRRARCARCRRGR